MKMIEMGHAGHFICGNRCQFRRNTYVNGYIVSTVGELVFEAGDRAPTVPLGAGPHKYETMVFHARKTAEKCCPYIQHSGADIDGRRWSTAHEAQIEHEKYVKKYAKKKNGLKK